MGKRRFITILVATFILSILSSIVQAASFQGLGHLGGKPMQSIASAISDDGLTVVGHSGGEYNSEAFRWTQLEGMIGLGDLPGGRFESRAYCASANGSVIGGFGAHLIIIPGPHDVRESFRWTETTGMIGLGVLYGGNDERALGVSDDGLIMVGAAHRQGYWPVAYRWTEEGGKELFLGIEQPSSAHAVSGDGTVIVGCVYPDWTHPDYNWGPEKAFRWTETDGLVLLGFLSGGDYSCAMDISNDGSCIVGYSESTSGDEAFRWTQTEGMIGLGDLPGGIFASCPCAVSADSSVIVGYGHTSSGQEAFIWNAYDGIRNLKDALVSDYGLNLTDWTLVHARGISADGLKIVGFGVNPDGYEEAWIATIPESTTSLDKIYWTDSAGSNDVSSSNLDGSGIENLIVGQFSYLSSIAIDNINGKMYFTDIGGTEGNSSSPAVLRADLDGSNVETLVTNVLYPRGIVLDVQSDKMYFADGPDPGVAGLGHIYRSNLDGTGQEVIVYNHDIAGLPGLNALHPTDIELDLINNKMYFTDWSNCIIRTNLDGSDITQLPIPGSNFSSIALDVENNALYVTDLGGQPGGAGTDPRVIKANLDGSNAEVLFDEFMGPDGLSLDLENDKMYFTNGPHSLNNFPIASILSANLDGTGLTTLHEGTFRPTDTALAFEPTVIPVAVDIKPGSCPNPLNVKSRGVVPVAILGSAAFDVTTIDAGSIFLNGARNVRSGYEDVAGFIADANDCECTTLGPDGYLDLTLKFMTQDIVATFGEVNHDDVLELQLDGVLYDETPVEGSDCVVIRGKHKPTNKADINKEGGHQQRRCS